MSDAPTLAIVGRTNRGKSSVVATLTEDDQIAISERPGTTRESAATDVVIDGVIRLEVYDTPGFEEAPRALAWLEKRAPSADQRGRALEEFLETFGGTDEFHRECELLTPIVRGGAAIVYVVDASEPYRANYESEMEILRWCGRPSIAILNQGADDEHATEWRSALKQFFGVVRDFDAHTASLDERVRLLETFRELDDAWRPHLGVAIDALRSEAERRIDQTAGIIADLIATSLSHRLETRCDRDQLSEKKRTLSARFHDDLREHYRRAQRNVEQVYRHRRSQWDVPLFETPDADDDLFAEKLWREWGLTPTILSTAASGAAVGLGLDAAVGGLSGGAGALIGGLIGAVGGAGAYVRKRYAQVTDSRRRVRELLGNRGDVVLSIGPLRHPSFPWILLDLSLAHHEAVSRRPHALQTQPETPPATSWTQSLPSEVRDDIGRALSELRAKPDGPARQALKALLIDTIGSGRPPSGDP